jgi:hypothetical protein
LVHPYTSLYTIDRQTDRQTGRQRSNDREDCAVQSDLDPLIVKLRGLMSEERLNKDDDWLVD